MASSRFALASCLVLSAIACDAGEAERQALRARVEAERLRAEELAAENDRLRDELVSERRALAREQEQRAARENDWLRYTEAVATLDLGTALEPFSVHLPQVDPATDTEDEPEPDPELERRRERALSIATSLGNLLRLEEVRSMDLLEGGTLLEGAIGPVVFRLLDDRGRLMGSLFAERLWLESSHAAHTVTLVLEEGYESRGGVRRPFPDGERRVVLPHVDPEPWRDAMPEIFPAERPLLVDDGLWDLGTLRRRLNERLRLDADGSFYQLKRLGGVWEDALTEVQLVHFDTDARIRSRIFADRLRIVRRPSGVQLVLEDGASVIGEETRPFVDGTFRIFLPQADVELWSRLSLPGATAAAEAASEDVGSS